MEPGTDISSSHRQSAAQPRLGKHGIHIPAHGDPLVRKHVPGAAKLGGNTVDAVTLEDRVKTILTAEKKLVQVTGTALFPGDIAPGMPSLSGGTVEVFGETRRIVQGAKNRNPDGTVNYCTLEVM